MKPQTTQAETVAPAKGVPHDRIGDAAEEALNVRELTLDELHYVGGGGVKDHSI